MRPGRRASVRVLLGATIITFALLVTGATSAAYFAPYIYFEFEYGRHGREPAVLPKPVVPVVGRWIPIASGSLETVSFFPRVFPVRGAVTFATGFRWNN